MTMILDIETISQDPEKLLADMPAFDAESVKLGNLKDPAKIEAKLRESEERHRRDYIDRAALDARTCHVRIGGMLDAETGKKTLFLWEPDSATEFLLSGEFPLTGNVRLLAWPDEGLMLANLMMTLKENLAGDNARCVTYYGNKFDLPLLFRRSWILGRNVFIPHAWRRGRYWSDRFLDLHELFTFGDREYHTGGLDGLGKTLGCKTVKTGTGQQFGDLYREDPIAAVRYLIADLDLIHEVAGKVGAIPQP